MKAPCFGMTQKTSDLTFNCWTNTHTNPLWITITPNYWWQKKCTMLRYMHNLNRIVINEFSFVKKVSYQSIIKSIDFKCLCLYTFLFDRFQSHTPFKKSSYIEAHTRIICCKRFRCCFLNWKFEFILYYQKKVVKSPQLFAINFKTPHFDQSAI